MAIATLIFSQDQKSSRAIYNLILPLLFCFCAFRWYVGCDFGSYMHLYEIKFAVVSLNDVITYREIGYLFILYVMHLFDMPWYIINVLGAASFFIGIHVMAKREPNPLLYLTLLFPMYIMGLGMSAVRQCLAAGFICVAFNAFTDKNIVKYLIFVGLGATFHNSAAVFVPFVVFLLPGNVAIKAFGSVVLVAPMIYLLSRSEAAQAYTNMYVGSGVVEAEGGKYRAIPVFLTGLLFMFFMRKRWKERYVDYNRIFIFSFAMIAVMPIVLVSSVIGDRFSYYLMPLVFAIQARAHKIFPKDLTLILVAAPLAVAVTYFLAWTSLSWQFSLCFVPYKTWWGSL